MELYLKNTSYGLFPCTDEDATRKANLKVGQVYRCDIKEVRNYEFHKKYFALINCTWDCLTEAQKEFFKSKDGLRKTLQLSAGYCERVYSLSKNEFQDVPKSISFGSMSEFAFRELYDRITHVIFGYVLKGRITEKDFNEHLINF